MIWLQVLKKKLVGKRDERRRQRRQDCTACCTVELCGNNYYDNEAVDNMINEFIDNKKTAVHVYSHGPLAWNFAPYFYKLNFRFLVRLFYVYLCDCKSSTTHLSNDSSQRFSNLHDHGHALFCNRRDDMILRRNGLDERTRRVLADVRWRNVVRSERWPVLSVLLV